jgi:hypothetical protein
MNNNCGEVSNEYDDKSKSRFVISTDIEAVDDGEAKMHTSRDAPVEVEYMYNYLPCMYTQPGPSANPSTISKCETQSGHSSLASASVEVSKSESMGSLSKSETWPPPMIVAVSTSDTDEDEDSLGRKTLYKSQGKRSHTDPFAPRVGKTLCWRKVNMTLVRLEPILHDGFPFCYLLQYLTHHLSSLISIRLDKVISQTGNFSTMSGAKSPRPKQLLLWELPERGKLPCSTFSLVGLDRVVASK